MPSHNFAFGPAEGAFRSAGDPIAFVVDRGLRLHRASFAGHALLKDRVFLQTSFGLIDATTQTNARRLCSAVKEVLKSGHVTTKLLSAEASLNMDFMSLDADTAGSPYIVIAAQIDADQSNPNMAGHDFGARLTCTEHKLVSALSDGCSVPRAARRMGIAPTTARTHLQRIFDKTGVRRQMDLLRVLKAPGQPIAADAPPTGVGPG